VLHILGIRRPGVRSHQENGAYRVHNLTWGNKRMRRLGRFDGGRDGVWAQETADKKGWGEHNRRFLYKEKKGCRKKGGKNFPQRTKSEKSRASEELLGLRGGRKKGGLMHADSGTNERGGEMDTDHYLRKERVSWGNN